MARRSRQKAITSAWTGQSHVVGLTPKPSEKTQGTHNSLDTPDSTDSLTKDLSRLYSHHKITILAQGQPMSGIADSTFSKRTGQVFSTEDFPTWGVSHPVGPLPGRRPRPVVLKEFHLFRQLPPELKLMVWEMAVAMVPGRQIKAVTRGTWSGVLCDMGNEWLPAYGLRNACCDSRRFWTKRWGDLYRDLFPFDPATDSLYITEVQPNDSEMATDGYFTRIELQRSMELDKPKRPYAYGETESRARGRLIGCQAANGGFLGPGWHVTSYHPQAPSASIYRTNMGAFANGAKSTIAMWFSHLSPKITHVATDHRVASLRWLLVQLTARTPTGGQPLRHTLKTVDIPSSVCMDSEVCFFDPPMRMAAMVSKSRWGQGAQRVRMYVDTDPEPMVNLMYSAMLMVFSKFEVLLQDGVEKTLHRRHDYDPFTDTMQPVDALTVEEEEERRKEEEKQALSSMQHT